MRKIATFAVMAALGAGVAAGPAFAEPGGCLKYGAAGAVGGHLMHHGVVGAVGGCAAGMYKRHEYRKHQRAMERQERQQHNGSHFGTPPQGGYQSVNHD